MTIPESETLLPEHRLTELLAGLPGWERNGATMTKTYSRSGWTSALAFVAKVGDAASAARHHPDIHVEGYKTVRVVLTTHASNGISQADIDLATTIDGLTS